MNRILVIRGGAIGDFIVTLPAIKALRDAYPDARLEILGYKHIAALAEERFYAERVRSIESPDLSRFFARDADLPVELANFFAGFDLILSYLYDPHLIFETNLRRSGARKVIRGPGKIDNGSHAIRQLLRPLDEIGIPGSDSVPKLFPTIEDRQRAHRFLDGLAEPIVAFHPGSGSERKNWPAQNWSMLGTYFLRNFTGSLLIVSGEADQTQIAQLESTWKDDPRVRSAKNLPLTDLAAVLENRIFFGHDSGVSHLAAAAGANCTLLFGPTEPTVWAPSNENARIIQAPDSDLTRLNVDLVRPALDQELMRIGIST